MLIREGSKVLLVSPHGVKVIADIDEADGCFVIRRNRNKHLLRKTNSYGFNAELLMKATKIKVVRLIIEESIYEIPIKLILEKGARETFEQAGYEEQIFLTLKEIVKWRKF